MPKLSKSIPLYMPASVNVNPEAGFKCGTCILGTRDTSECIILEPPNIDLEYGICGLYIPGKNITSKDSRMMEIVPKKIAGYSEEGPTYCGTCKHFIHGSGKGSGECKVVSGNIDYYGCCNGWTT